ncbi:sigma70-ECF and Sigma70_r4_2 domain-containing protein [Ktedonobacteria bacterium brp13]|nr:sigma70-ECF and Sigma70_r4_2 domain-containing protein [Ktedonobacteria bacterium brp13]
MVKHSSAGQIHPFNLDIWLHNLPIYNSPDFWGYLEQHGIPLELLARLYRCGSADVDASYRTPERQRLLSIILTRQRERNKHWARATIRKYCSRRHSEQTMLAEDLLADLEEELCRSLIGTLYTPHSFWEINFINCVAYARRRVRRSFLIREGHWRNPKVTYGRRIPRDLTYSIDQQIYPEHEDCALDIEDEGMRISLLSVELSDLYVYVSQLPGKQRYVVECIFWQDCTEKDIARRLGISDRTVRNHLHKACVYLSHNLYELMLND